MTREEAFMRPAPPPADPSLTLGALFERRAARAPHQVALRYGETALTYRQLDERANHLGAQPTPAGGGAGDAR